MVSLRHDLIFEGTWKRAIDYEWRFEIYAFLEGNIELLKEHSINYQNKTECDKYIVIESQGDGREINRLTWFVENDKYQLSCEHFA